MDNHLLEKSFFVFNGWHLWQAPIGHYKEVKKNVVLETGENAPKVQRQEVSLSEEETQKAREKFAATDKDGNGVIDKEELKALLQETVGKKMSTTMVNR